MTVTLLAANAAWTGLVIALWTKRLWEKAGKIMRVEKHMIVTGKIAALPLLTKKSL